MTPLDVPKTLTTDNQPPTISLPQSSQIQDVAIISSSGGILWGVVREILQDFLVRC
jgi:hypothetical protein